MTSPSPLPPPAGPTVRVAPVKFGQPWTDPDGGTHIAEEDMVLLELLIDGAPAAIRTQTPESAIALARLLMDAAGRCFRDDVDDHGKRLPAAERLARFNKAWTGES